MINILKRKTQMASAALVTGMIVSSSNVAHATTDLDTTVKQLGNQSESLPQLINGVFFIAGIGLVGLGLFGVKKHVDSGGQEKLPPALAKAGIGGALMAIPVVADNAVQTVLGGATDAQGVTAQTTSIF